jgi:hypothetical protein
VLSGAANDVERMHVRACRCVDSESSVSGLRQAASGGAAASVRGGGRGAWLALDLAG